MIKVYAGLRQLTPLFMAYETESAWPSFETDIQRKRRRKACLTWSEIHKSLVHKLECWPSGPGKKLGHRSGQELDSEATEISLPCGHPGLPIAKLVGMLILNIYIWINCCPDRSGIHYTTMHYTHIYIHFYFWIEGGVALAKNMCVMGRKSCLGRSACCLYNDHCLYRSSLQELLQWKKNDSRSPVNTHSTKHFQSWNSWLHSTVIRKCRVIPLVCHAMWLDVHRDAQ